MKTMTQTEIGRPSVNGRTLIVTLMVLLSIGAIGYSLRVSRLNAELEATLRDERLKNERLLSEKLAIEKDFNSTKEALRILEKKISELDAAVASANERLLVAESELALTKKKRKHTQVNNSTAVHRLG